MAKPILIAKMPPADREMAKNVRDTLCSNCPDYNVITVFDGDCRTPQFEVFNVQDYPQIDFEELKTKLETQCGLV